MKNVRGYSLVGLYNPKNEQNVGGVLRAAHVYGAAAVIHQGNRFKRQHSDTTKAWRHIPMFMVDDLFGALHAYSCVPVAVEITDNARKLFNYTHPERAFYIFGPEDGSLPDNVIKACRDIIYVPTRFCMNLAATVNVVLYDRMAKLS